MSCEFCQKSYVQGCWTAEEAARCGNMSDEHIKFAKQFSAAVEKVEAARKEQAEETERYERDLLRRLKAKYET